MSNSKEFNHIESIYWVFTQLCNDQCIHCYNNSGPDGERISTEECLAVVENLPESAGRIILSGGEPLTERPKLYAILDKLQEKYKGKTQIMLQTNGDLLTGKRLDTLIEKGVSRFDIASIDRYHKHKGERLNELRKLFESRGVNGDNNEPLIQKENYLHEFPLSWGYWGANEEMWLGGNWARGRALDNDIWMKDGDHNFCAVVSGAIGFLKGGESVPNEISIQLWKINPCCPGTKDPLGDARIEKVSRVLAKFVDNPIFQKLNQGDPYRMGESIGVDRDYARKRCGELGNVCKWCDEFFSVHYDIKRNCTRHTAGQAEVSA